MAQTTTRPGPQPIRKRPKQWPFPLNIYQSAVGRKWVMAVTGIVLLGFVVTHMIGNLHLFEGPLPISTSTPRVLQRAWIVHVIPGYLGALGRSSCC